MRPADAAWRVQRNATETRTIAVPGIDLTGQDQLLQIRSYPDAPGLPLISLSPAAAGSQGLSVAYVVDTGSGTSTIVAQIDRATIQALLPFVDNGTEPGADVVLAYDHLIALPGDILKPVYRGAFIIEPGVSVPWTTDNVPALPGVPQAQELGAAITRANTAATNADAKAALVTPALAAVTIAGDRANAAAAQIVADAGPTLLIKPGTGTFPAVADAYFPGRASLYSNFDGLRRQLRAFADVLDVTRSTAGSFRDTAGALQLAPANIARLGYRYASTWVLAGLLVEAQSTNLFLSSQDWTVTANAWANSGAGNSTATAIIEDATNAQHFKSAAGTNTQSFTAGITQVLAFRGSERAGSAKRYALVFLTGTVLATNTSAVFDLATGTAYLNGAGASGTEAGCIPDGLGSWICWWRFTPTGTATNAVRIGLSSTTTATTSSYQGDGTSGLNITDAQMTVGSNVLSAIATSTTQVTRAADQFAKALDVGFNPAAGTMMARVYRTMAPPAASVARIWQLDDGTENNRITIRAGGGSFVYETVVGGIVTGSVVGPAWAGATGYSVSATYERSTGALILRVGTAEYTGTASALPAGLTTRRHGCDSTGANQLNGFLLPFQQHATLGVLDGSYFPRVLSAAERSNYA